MRTPRYNDERGQTAPEYMGGLLLVSLIIAALFTSGVASVLVSHVEAIICKIAGGENCEGRVLALEPCLVSSSTDTSSAHLFVGIVEVGKESVLIREDFSDGTTRFTIIDSTELKGELFAGARAKAGKWGLEAAAQAAAGGQLEGAQVYEVDTEDADEFEDSVAAAGGLDGLIRDVSELNDEIPIVGWDNPLGGLDNLALDVLGVDEDDPTVDPTEEYVDVSALIEGDAGAGVGGGGFDVDVEAAAEAAAGAKIIHEGERSGEVEFYFSFQEEAGASLTAGLLGPNVQGEAEAVATLVLDENGEPKTLKLSSTASYTGDFGLEGEASGKDAEQIHSMLEEVSLSSDAGEGHMITAGAELDLSDPVNREVALRLLNPRTLGPAIPDLVERLDEDGRLTLDLFELSREESEAGIKIGLGVGGGGDGSQSSEEQTASGSYVREPGGTFQQRICLD